PGPAVRWAWPARPLHQRAYFSRIGTSLSPRIPPAHSVGESHWVVPDQGGRNCCDWGRAGAHPDQARGGAVGGGSSSSGSWCPDSRPWLTTGTPTASRGAAGLKAMVTPSGAATVAVVLQLPMQMHWASWSAEPCWSCPPCPWLVPSSATGQGCSRG